MPNSTNESRTTGRIPQPLRRKLILWIPAAILASVTGSVVTAAFKFLRPRSGEVGAGEGWLSVAKVGEIKGDEPLLRQVFVEHRAGWAATMRGHPVFVLPGAEPRIVSAVCPHEGCEVEWSAEQKKFLCPCHDSAFNPDGARMSGPALSDLARLTTRINGDTLEMQFNDTSTPSTSADSQIKG